MAPCVLGFARVASTKNCAGVVVKIPGNLRKDRADICVLFKVALSGCCAQQVGGCTKTADQCGGNDAVGGYANSVMEFQVAALVKKAAKIADGEIFCGGDANFLAELAVVFIRQNVKAGGAGKVAIAQLLVGVGVVSSDGSESVILPAGFDCQGRVLGVVVTVVTVGLPREILASVQHIIALGQESQHVGIGQGGAAGNGVLYRSDNFNVAP